MRPVNGWHLFINVILFAVFAIIQGCDVDNKEEASSGVSVAKETQLQSAETEVAQLAQRRWEARIAKDWKRVYEMMSPGYRATHGYEVFAAQLQRSPLLYRKVEVEKVDCIEDHRCTVKLKVENEYAGTQASFQGMVSVSVVEEQWLRIDGQWWFAK